MVPQASDPAFAVKLRCTKGGIQQDSPLSADAVTSKIYSFAGGIDQRILSAGWTNADGEACLSCAGYGAC